MDFAKLKTFGDTNDPSAPIISPFIKTNHPESALVPFLYHMYCPSTTTLFEWARLIAGAVEFSINHIYKPKPPQLDPKKDFLTMAVNILHHLETLKISPEESEQTTEEGAVGSINLVPQSHSIDMVRTFRNVVIDVIMAHIILQANSLSSQLVSKTQKGNKKKKKKGLQPQTSELTGPSKEATKTLGNFQRRQNFQPLLFFVFGGIRGLFLASRDWRKASITDCMSFINMIATIVPFSKDTLLMEEPVWKNTCACVAKFIAPFFNEPDKIISIENVPTCYELAVALASDFLLHWPEDHPPSPFLSASNPPMVMPM